MWLGHEFTYDKNYVYKKYNKYLYYVYKKYYIK